MCMYFQKKVSIPSLILDFIVQALFNLRLDDAACQISEISISKQFYYPSRGF